MAKKDKKEPKVKKQWKLKVEIGFKDKVTKQIASDRLRAMVEAIRYVTSQTTRFKVR